MASIFSHVFSCKFFKNAHRPSFSKNPPGNRFCYDTVLSRTFKIERITIFILSFCIGLVTQLNGPALGVLKHHYITKRIREPLINNSRFLIYNLLNQLLYSLLHGIKESCFFVTEFVETFDLNN